MGLFGSDPRLVSDGEIYSKVRELISEAEEDLLVISPYIDPTVDFVRQLEAAALERQVNVGLIFRKDKLSEYRSKDWFLRLEKAGVALGVIERLHSKVYLNEASAIVTSMNFYSSSGENSFEVGVLFEKSHKLYGQLDDYLDSLERHIEEVRFDSPAPMRRERRRRSNAPVPTSHKSSAGHCIRCSTAIPLNAKRPYCAEDFEKWARYENEDFEDKHCHRCGREHPATMRKPLCRTCYSQ
jgi:phosphatidylserine/phosphatidylglycerophosphate/cardiolipin synthase-like enzyme